MSDIRQHFLDEAQGRAAAQALEIQRLSKKVANQAREITTMRECLEEKNRELDAMHYVWCDGSCERGVHRYTPGELTQDLVERAVRNVDRLCRKFLGRAYRARILQADAQIQRSVENAWGQVQKFATWRMQEKRRAERWKRLAKKYYRDLRVQGEGERDG